MKQLSFAALTYQHKKIITKREKFLNEMEKVVPWKRLLKLIEPHYPKAGKGRPPLPMESMLRIYFLQQWYALSDPAAEEALYEIESIRHFAGLELVVDATIVQAPSSTKNKEKSAIHKCTLRGRITSITLA